MVFRRMNHTFMSAAMDTHDPEVIQSFDLKIILNTVTLWCDPSKRQTNSGKTTSLGR